MAPGTEVAPAEAFALPGYRGERRRGFPPGDLAAAVARLVDPGAASETLHWGRNYLYVVLFEGSDEPETVVKQFRNQKVTDRLKRRLAGSKAEKSWRAARALVAAGVGTPEPLMQIESTAPGGPSFFVTRRLDGVFEARYFFRALNDGRVGELFPQVDADELLRGFGRTLRRLHDAGVWHRDVSVGNLLVRAGRAGREPEVYLIDLNRARLGRRLSVGRRTRDLCRLRIFRRADRETFLRAYWGERARAFGWKRWLFALHAGLFLAKVRAKELARRPFRSLGEAVKPRRAHVHIPPPPAEASARDRVVWDQLSDQPHQHTSRPGRLLLRLADAPLHAREAAAGLAALPRIARRYRELKRGLYREPVAFGGLGVALRPWPEAPEELLEAVDELGVRSVLLRLHPWQEEHRHEEELARALHGRELEVAFALPQNRELVRDPARWRAALEEIGERFRPYGRHFQVGQAVNRSKWGVWNHREYLALARIAGEVLRRDPEVELLGPAVIDYELYRTAGLVNVPADGARFDALASLLYVDRRGAPENRQLGFDTVDKVVQLRALADTARRCAGRSWITEFNWPLREGPHSPAGRDVAVDEETQADYLARFFLLALGTGLVERAYWWQLVARGYGLAYPGADGTLVRRPSFRALATLARQVEGATFLGPLAAVEPARLYRFRRADGSELVVGWSTAASAEARLPRPATEVVDGAGEASAPPPSEDVDLGPAPSYFRLTPDAPSG